MYSKTDFSLVLEGVCLCVFLALHITLDILGGDAGWSNARKFTRNINPFCCHIVIDMCFYK